MRRHAALPPAELSAPAWLAAHADPLATTDAVGSLDDLEPLRAMVGNAPIVALADGTHGTHEYFTSKLRLIEFLVTRMGFDTLAIEGSFSQMDRVNTYVQGGAIDLRTEIFPHANEIDYHFWAVEEFMDVANWMRLYNAHRQECLCHTVSVVGIDVYDGDAAAAMIPDLIAQHRDDDAAHAQTVAVQALTATDPPSRNHNLALNVQWALDHRSANRRIIVWGHGEHFGKTISIEKVDNAGIWLDRMYGANYIAIGNAMWDGIYLGLAGLGPQEVFVPVVAADPHGYENFFVASNEPAFLLSLHQPLHSFLAQTRPLRTAGFSNQNNWDYPVDLAKKFDAMLYVRTTSPTHPLPAPQ
jgi:erythromycin esterase-like protein